MVLTVRYAAHFGLVTLILLAGSTVSGAPTSAADNDLTIHTITGVRSAGSHIVRTEVVVGLRPGVDPRLAAGKVLEKVAPGSTVSDDFIFTGTVYSRFFDHGRRNDVVTQFYNPGGDPTGGGLVALKNAQATWNAVRDSSFRFAYGGTTDRCASMSLECPGGPRGPDGFDDVGWRSIPWDDPSFFVAFGYVAQAEDFFTGETFESDMTLNIDIAPFAWFTDGVEREGFFDVDLETLVLHENGHVAGLWHSFEASTLMAPSYTTIKRALTDAERDGIAFLYPRKPSSLVEGSSAHNFSLVAELGAPAPGGSTFQDHFEPGGINASGDVTFVTDAPGGQALFLTQRDRVTAVARPGVSAAGVRLGFAPIGAVPVNDAGSIAFSWLLDPTIPDPFDGTNVGLFRKRHGRAIEALVLPDVTPAPGGGLFRGTSSADLSNGDDVIFNGRVDSPFGLQYGAFVARGDGSLASIARPGDPMPGGGRLHSARAPSISGNGGHVAFNGRLVGATGDTIYVRRGDGGSLERIAGPGDPAPGGGLLLSALFPRVNSRGEVLFGGLVQQAGQPTVRALFLASRGSIRAVARRGDPMPDGWRFRGLVGGIMPWTLNDAGDVAFVARTETDPADFYGTPVIVEGTGVYASSGGELRYVAREGAVISGVGSLFSVSPPLTAAMIDDRGDVVFAATTIADRWLLLKAAPKVYTPR